MRLPRTITLPGGLAIPALVAAFGADMLTPEGALDRDRMRALAFGDAASKARLEAVLHPLIGREAGRQADQAAGRPVVFDVPLLTESSIGARVCSGCWWWIAKRLRRSRASQHGQAGRCRRLSAWWPCKPLAPRAAPLPMR
jgi:dephospho-CoA kinase